MNCSNEKSTTAFEIVNTLCMPVFAQRRVPLNRRKKVPERRIGIFAVLENRNAQSHKSMAKFLNKQHCFVTNQLTTAWKRSACIKLSYFSKTHVTNVKIYIATRTKNSYPCYAAANTPKNLTWFPGKPLIPSSPLEPFAPELPGSPADPGEPTNPWTKIK